MYDDERRNPQELETWLLADFIADPEALASRFEGMRARDVRNRKKLEEAEEELRRLERETRDLRRSLGSARAALDAYRAETARLKADLKRVRGSHAYRLGRVLSKPAGVVRRPPRRAAADQAVRSAALGSLVGTPPDSGATSTVGSASRDTAAGAPTWADSERQLGDYGFDELLERFDDEQTPERLGHVLSRAWYHQGLIKLPAQLLRAHPAVMGALDGSSAVLARRILGADRLLTDGLSLPARGAGAAYRPERGRVMYCAFSTPAFNTNGYSVRTRGVAAGLRQAGTDVVVVGRSGYPWDSKTDVKRPAHRRHVVELDGVTYVHLPGHKLGSLPTDQYILECADAFVREARVLRPSLIHAASNHQIGLAALIAARRLGVPFVYEVRGLWEITEASDKPGWDLSERYRQQVELETLVATQADSVLAITAQTRDELVRRGVDPARITLAPNAVDPHEFLPLPKDEAYAAQRAVRSDVPVIGFAGSMVPYEGLGLLLDAAALLRDAGVDFQIAIAGSGTAEPSLKDQVADLGLEDIVRFLGRVPASEMPRLLSLFDIMPCPRLSLPVTEMVSPLKPLEALSSAKAVVLSDVAPHLDIAGTHQQRALVFPAGDAAALAETLRRLIDDPDLRADLGRTGRLWCLDERTWSHLGDTMRAAYDSARAVNKSELAQRPGRALASLRVGLIADEFTTETLAGSVQIVPFDRDRWTEQLELGLDLVFIESAWKGNGGQWHRGVGYYSPEEHADLAGLLTGARRLGIPTVFWNKEDPVHFERFVRTASLCDHVFTTDGNKVVPYLAAGHGRVRTASSLPFYAQPRIHNPLPGSRPFESTVAYAGTYYGDRYAKRSAELSTLLETARPFGLAIYDRQADIPDSPYHFPPVFRSVVRGSLPYSEVIDSYKAHSVNLNVNSVADSPSMFSRRVVEVAASGGVVLSGPGRGIDETFGGAIPTSADPSVWRALLRTWASDPEARLRESWMQLRAVLRAHTVDTALTILARTAGLPVAANHLPAYAAVLGTADAAVLESLARQSVLPLEVWCEGDAGAAREALEPLGVRVMESTEDLLSTGADFVGRVDRPVARTHFEDLLLSQDFGPWDRIIDVAGAGPSHGEPLASLVDGVDSVDGLVAADVLRDSGDLRAALSRQGVRGVRLRVPVCPNAPAAAASSRTLPSSGELAERLAGKVVLVAGHDLKFAGQLISAMEAAGAEVIIDEWTSHTDHVEERSLELLDRADVVFCEWGLGNAVWYSQHVQPHQRLVVRVHLQELTRPYLARIRHEAVDAFIFVGELIKEAAIQSHGVPRDRSHVIANTVDVEALSRPKSEEAERTLGLVGIVPQRKRLDLALDVLEGLIAREPRYRLRIKGKTAEDYPWMSQRPDEMAYYEKQSSRIDAINERHPGAVRFDGHGNDMPEWYRSIGVALSVSDFESFHLTLADGAASGALPALLAWDGAEYVYPREWISPNVSSMIERIATETRRPCQYAEEVRRRFPPDLVIPKLLALVSGLDDRGATE